MHDQSICERHLPYDVLSDPDGAISRNRPALLLWHRTTRRRLYAAAAAGFLVPLVPVFVSAWYRPVPVLVAGVVGLAPFVAMTWSAVRHEKLQPWCPWCRDDGGLHFSPAPDPAGAPNPVNT